MAFKADMVQSLISDCGFKLLLFEASFYEFAKLHEMKEVRKEIDQQSLETALGFIYRDKIQLQSLIEFITSEMKSGSLSVGGLDYQPGGRGQDYSNFLMLDDIVAAGDTQVKNKCKAALKQRIYSNFPKDAPYDAQQKEALLNCLIEPDHKDAFLASQRTDMMRTNLSNYIGHDFLGHPERRAGRSAFMYENFNYWIELFEAPPKTIVWTSSVHATKSREIYAANLGSLVKENFGDSAYSLGFSALQGSLRTMSGNIIDLPHAPENSIEVAAFSTIKDDIAFLDTAELVKLRTRPGAAFNAYQEKDWSTIFDGLVVFREQNPL